jgi:hypothetical protein
MTQSKTPSRRGFLIAGLAAGAAACEPYRYGGPWGPRPYAARPTDTGWRTVGTVVTSLPSGHTTIAVSGTNYYYNDGNFFRPDGRRYRVVRPPYGAVVPRIPPASSRLTVRGDPFRYYYGTYYRPHDGGRFRVAPPPPGAVVRYLPPGYKVRRIDGRRYYEYGGARYRRERRDGVDVYIAVEF